MDNSTFTYKSLLKKLKNQGGVSQLSCEFCFKDITNATYIKCAECPNILICVNCYIQGLEKGCHTRLHKFFIIDSLKFPLFNTSWSAKEENLLLESMLKYGYGNWGAISKALYTKKSSWECEKHYKQIYMKKSPAEMANIEIISYRDDRGYIVQTQSNALSRFKEIMRDPMPIPDRRNELEKPALSDFAGYIPFRRDFEVEWENDIELYLADLEFYDDDRYEETQIKLKQLEAYNKVLDEREERKKFVMERWPIEVKNERKFRNPVEKSIYQSMKPFARLLPPDKHIALCEGLTKEYILKLKLEELREARSLGIATEEDFKKFLNEKRNSSIKGKEYDVIFKEPFMHKMAQQERDQQIAGAEIAELNSTINPSTQLTSVEEEFCDKMGFTPDEYLGLKDKICEQIESKGFITEELLNGSRVETNKKKELFDFVVKLRTI
ncbi:TADA2A [Blepharisma stoltei]|uniref:Transcriptional adapter n=1 Tax=Blepharisma stoltei TaxID=1481888 RepID=A0AAU9IR27_9CILI|nr:unnamed protein product [Blepharisma stoltei]